MAPSTLRTLLAGLLVAALAVPSPSASAAGDDLQRYLFAARRLFQNADNERALEQLQRAKALAHGLEDDVTIALYEGVILADFNRLDEARAAFRTALLLEPDAKLPLKVSPKLRAQFDEMKVAVHKELARTQLQQEAERAEPTKVSTLTPPPAPAMPAAPASDAKAVTAAPIAAPPPAPLAANAHVAPPVEVEAKSPSRATPWVPLVVTGAAAIVGGAGLLFGQLSKQSYRTAQDATWQDERIRAVDASQRQATTANVLFVAAGALAAGAAVTWVW